MACDEDCEEPDDELELDVCLLLPSVGELKVVEVSPPYVVVLGGVDGCMGFDGDFPVGATSPGFVPDPDPDPDVLDAGRCESLLYLLVDEFVLLAVDDPELEPVMP